jgi:hypothetical protein
MSTSDPVVAELQGLFGAFSFPEKLLQKIWLRGDFDRARAATVDGQPVQVLHPGKWNLLGGPDFLGARWRVGGRNAPEISGDVEVHLRAEDWAAHRHAQDPAYARVRLHVVLFPPPTGQVTRGSAGEAIPVLALLPLLHRSLEEFAADEAVETLAQRPLARVAEELAVLPGAELEGLLRREADRRWRQKVHFARLRLERLGWEAACHHAALEVLGFRFNRAPMLRLAGEFPLPAWVAGTVAPDALYTHERDHWSLQGVRPANHPRTRLRQYAEWIRLRPDWPARLRRESGRLALPDSTAGTREVRSRHGFAAQRERLAVEICGGTLGGTRFDTLVCDALLPLLAVESDRALHALWFHWFPGDLPPAIVGGLRQLGYFDGRERPASQGAAQGLLGWWVERENAG